MINKATLPWLAAISIGVGYECFSGTFISAFYFYTILFLGIPWIGAVALLARSILKGLKLATSISWAVAAIISLPFVLFITERFVFSCHRLPLAFGYLVSGLLALLGVHSCVFLDPLYQNTIVSIQNELGWRQISITLEKLDPGVICALGWTGIILSGSIVGVLRRLKFLGVCAAAIIALAALKCVLTIMLYYDQDWIEAFWNPLVTFVIYAPVSFFMGRISEIWGQPPSDVTHIRRSNYLYASTCALVVLFLASFILMNYYVPSGERANGKVLLDDSHSNWEWSSKDFDTNSYGERATYSANGYRELLQKYWTVDVNTDHPLNELSLKDYKVVILKTPTKPYSNDEENALVDFVNNGGGLYLIGDHTNLFGMSTYLNTLGRHFGLEFEFTDQYDLTTLATTTFYPSYVWNHPLAANLGRLEFLTTCTLQCPVGADIIQGKAMGVENVDYSHVNFFGNIHPESDKNWGQFIQMASVYYGKGQVMAYSDSTCISTFCVFSDYKPTIAVSAVDFLNRDTSFGASWEFVRANSLWFILAAAVLFVVNPFASSMWYPSLAIGSVIFAVILGQINVHNFTLPSRSAENSICFDTSKSYFSMPAMVDFRDEVLHDKTAYDTWFLNFLRMGYEPYADNPLQLTGPPKLTVFINPQLDRWTPTACQAMIAKLRKGEKYLILADWSVEGERKAVRQLLAASDISVDFQKGTSPDSYSMVDSKGKHLNVDLGSDQSVILSQFDIGNGELSILSGCPIFSREGLGPVYHQPTNQEKALCEVQYALVNYIFHNGDVAVIADRANLYKLAGLPTNIPVQKVQGQKETSENEPAQKGT